MRFTSAVLLMGLAVAATAQPGKISLADNPEAYWSRGFGCSGNAESYSISLRVDDADAVSSRIDGIMTAAGAPTQISMSGYYSGSQPHSRQMNYSVPAKSAEKLAKKLTDMGELMNYSMNRQNSGDALKQIEERISVLEGELANTDALAKMPSAAFFLRSRLNQLKQSRDVCASAGSKSSISINLQPKPAETKP